MDKKKIQALFKGPAGGIKLTDGGKRISADCLKQTVEKVECREKNYKFSKQSVGEQI